jgi:hypothetical protein
MYRFIIGAVLILAGVGVYLNQGNPISTGTIIEYAWPSLFVIPLGLFFHWLYFSMTAPRGVGLLIPGGIVFTAGVVLQIAVLSDSWGSMWPGFILAVAVGLFEFYWFGRRNRYLLIPIVILSVVSLLFFAVFTLGTLFNYLAISGPVMAIVLIAIGVLVLFSDKHKA